MRSTSWLDWSTEMLTDDRILPLSSVRGTYGEAAVRDHFSLYFDGGDPWGSCLGTLFAICETLYRRHVDIPAHWDFKPGLGLEIRRDEPADDDDDVQVYELMTDPAYTDQGLLYWGELLSRYAGLLESKGLDY